MKNLPLKTIGTIILISAGMIASTNASAGICTSGFLADIACVTGITSPQAARTADHAWNGFKHANPGYGQWEDQFTNDVRSNMGLQPHCQDAYGKYGQHLGCF